MPPRRTANTLYWIIIGAGVIVCVLTVRQFPILYPIDEAWFLSYADGLRWTGQVSAPIAPESPSQLVGVLHILAGNLLGAITAYDSFALRYVSTISGIGMLGVVYFIGRLHQNHAFGLLCAALCATNLLWLTTSHIGRGDMLMSTCLWGGLALTLYGRTHRSARWTFLGGIVTALSVHMHPLGALTCITMGLWWVLDFQAARAEWRLIGAYVCGGLLVGISFFLTNIAPDVGQFLQVVSAQTTGHGARFYSSPEATYARHQAYFQGQPLEFLVLLIGLLGVVISQRRGKAGRLALLVLLIIASYAFLIADPQIYYIITWLPGLVILAGHALQYLSKRFRLIYTGLWIGAVLINLLWIGIHLNDNWNMRVLSAQQRIIPYLTSTETILGTNIFYFTYRQPNYRASAALRMLTDDQTMSLSAALAEVNPDAVISANGPLETFLPRFVVLNYALDIWDQPEVTPLLTDYAVSRVISTEFGEIVLWRRK